MGLKICIPLDRPAGNSPGNAFAGKFAPRGDHVEFPGISDQNPERFPGNFPGNGISRDKEFPGERLALWAGGVKWSLYAIMKRLYSSAQGYAKRQTKKVGGAPQPPDRKTESYNRPHIQRRFCKATQAGLLIHFESP